MEEPLYRRLIDECVELGVEEVGLHNFGEPLLDIGIAERIKYAKSKGVKRVTFFTNASLLVEPKSLEIIKAGLDAIYISIDGATKYTFEEVRRGLNYEEVVNNIKSFLEIRHNYPKVYLFFLCFHKNKKEVPLFKRQWKCKVDGINISVYRERDKPDKTERNLFAPCPYLWQEMFILWNGDVVLCCEDYDARLIVGNVHSSGIRNVWNSSDFKEIRKLHLSHLSNNIDLCNTCELNLWWRWVLT
jgi:radical SAM protein with 4Fe4S-binding SPASM domain